MNIAEIVWPIFYIAGVDRIYTEFNVTYVKNINGESYVLDNKNMKGDTLGSRRLKITDNLYNFRVALFSLAALATFTEDKPVRNRYMIDTEGKVFKYVKTKMYKIYCYKIKNIQYLKTLAVLTFIGTIIKVTIPIQMLRTHHIYAQILEYNNAYMIYNLLEHKVSASRKKL